MKTIDRDDRAKEFAIYIINTGSTLRQTAERFGYCKSTVHQDITRRLPKVNLHLFNEVSTVLKNNWDEKHIRGGKATQFKYKKELV